MKINSSVYTTILAGLLINLLFSCKKHEAFDNYTTMGAVKPLDEIIFNPDLSYGTMKDQDGNTYKTIVIGTQTWMAENLRTIHYRNGDPIPNVTGGKAWMDLTNGAYCNYNNDAKYSIIYGRLYNFYSVIDSRDIAPPGWHLPSTGDWVILLSYIDPQYVTYGYLSNNEAGLKLKESGWIHWDNWGTPQGTNETGFTAIPGGVREPESNGSSWFLSGFGTWWNSDSSPMGMSSIICEMRRGTDLNYKSGYSVRLVKD